MIAPTAGGRIAAKCTEKFALYRQRLYKTGARISGRNQEREYKVKSLKMFGLAALAALMAMAFVGASSASAESTALCSADENPCAAKNQISHVHEVSVGKATLLSSLINIEADVLFLGDALKNGSGEPLGNPLIIHGTFTYTNASSGCVITEENGPAEIKVLRTGAETAKVTGEGLVHVVCSGFIDCRYNGTGLVGTGKGPLNSAQTPDNGEVSLQKVATTKEAGGFLCPKTASLDIVTSPLVASYISN